MDIQNAQKCDGSNPVFTLVIDDPDDDVCAAVSEAVAEAVGEAVPALPGDEDGDGDGDGPAKGVGELHKTLLTWDLKHKLDESVATTPRWTVNDLMDVLDRLSEGVLTRARQLALSRHPELVEATDLELLMLVGDEPAERMYDLRPSTELQDTTDWKVLVPDLLNEGRERAERLLTLSKLAERDLRQIAAEMPELSVENEGLRKRGFDCVETVQVALFGPRVDEEPRYCHVAILLYPGMAHLVVRSDAHFDDVHVSTYPELRSALGQWLQYHGGAR